MLCFGSIEQWTVIVLKNNVLWFIQKIEKMPSGKAYAAAIQVLLDIKYFEFSKKYE